MATTKIKRTQLDNVQEGLSGASLTPTTLATNDKILIQDTSDSNNLKTVTPQEITDLAGGGSSRKIFLHENFATSYAAFATARTVTLGVSATASITINGLTLNNDTTGLGLANCLFRLFRPDTATASFNIFTKSVNYAFNMVCTSGVTPTSLQEVQAYNVCTVAPTSAPAIGIKALRASSQEYFGVIALRNNVDALRWYFATKDTTTELLTDISSSIDTLGRGYFYIEYTPSTSVKLYWNDSLIATHTTSIPTGALTGAINVSTLQIGNDVTGSTSTTSQKAMQCNSLTLEVLM